MAMTLQEYFRTRCMNTLDAERNIDSLYTGMVKQVHNTQLKEALKQHQKSLQTEMRNLEKALGKNHNNKAERMEGAEVVREEKVVILGRGWIGTMSAEMVETHSMFSSSMPQNMIDINDALVEDEIIHFNLATYTSLIVLAKQLGEWDIAQVLQQNIDSEMHMRDMWEGGALWQIVNAERGMQTEQMQAPAKPARRKAA